MPERQTNSAGLSGRVDLSGVRTARLDEYFGMWAVEPGYAAGLWQHVRGLDLQAHVARNVKRDPNTGQPISYMQRVEVAGMALAVIHAAGTLMKAESSLDESSSTVVLRQDVRRAMSDASIAGVLVVLDSPGGTVAGTADLAADVAALAAAKPVIAFAEDLCASAAYWIASQAERIVANHGTAKIGSVGTLLAFYDYSKMAEREGIEPVVISTGPLKGTAFPGTKVTDEQRSYLQGLIDQTQAFFAAAVADGRGMSIDAVNELATGGVFSASDALANGLIDGIGSMDEALAAVAQLAKQPTQNAEPRRGAAARAPRSLAAAWNQSNLTDLAASAASTLETELMKTKTNKTDTSAEQTPAEAGNKPAATETTEAKPAAEQNPPAAANPPAATTESASASAPPEAPAQPAAAAAEAKTPATLAELKAAIPGADASFREACLEAGASLADAKDRWIAHCESRIDEVEDQLAKATSAAEGLRGDEGSVPFQAAEQTPQQRKQNELSGKLGDNLATYASSIKLPRIVNDN